jgi:hypothetical protein
MDYPLQNCKDNKRGDTQAYIIRSIQVYWMLYSSYTKPTYHYYN